MAMTEMEARLAVLETSHQSMRSRIFGNGNPGELARMERERKDDMRRVEEKLDSIEKKLSKVITAIAFLAGGAGVGVSSLVHLIFGG